jgi:hydroxymethylglutaryl-CoA reductase (NADPH)
LTGPVRIPGSAAQVAAATPELVPRLLGQGYAEPQVAERRAWVEAKTGARLELVGRCAVPTEAMRGNVENPVGSVQVPLGVAGPLAVRGEHAEGVFYVPFATTEGALVRSYERGMVALTRSGGAVTRVWTDENRVCPVFTFADAVAAADFTRGLPGRFEAVREAAEATTRHGRLLRLVPHPMGREVIVEFAWSTGDAGGMNMIVRGTDAAARRLAAETGAEGYQVFSGLSAEKRAAGNLLAGGKGKRVTASVRLPRRVVRAVLATDAAAIAAMWRRTVIGHLQAASLGYNGHYANGLAALFIATGQDVANVANAAVGVTSFEATAEGDLHASVHLPSLTLGTVGGGTGLGTARECLEMIGCAGLGKARKLAEIVAATLLAGELSMGAAVATGDLVAGHERYGRNPPGEAAGGPEPGADGGGGP